ncbi:MAG: ABC transporter substrate-binding protein [Rhodocyclaceae bacterium]|nr:ABC transporter substrate-binding protein [Rhodocyclaceae bacterium]
MRRWIFMAALIATGCAPVWNDPYPAQERGANILYTAFTERPKHLDPVQSYSEDEIAFTAQIYEPPLQYHYLKRPYELMPATATKVPEPIYLAADGSILPKDAPAQRIAYTDYVIEIKPGILYQPHPAFAEQPSDAFARAQKLADFPNRATRELVAEDYVYGIKRLAHPHLHSPILGLMSEYIVGLAEFAKELRKVAPHDKGWLDLRAYPLAGVTAIDRYRYRIRIKGKYPQFLYWLAMPFFAPMPWEADRFHSQPGMAEKNLTLDWYPIGTGPYMLTENDPNARMVLEKNPNFRGETYPCEGEEGDAERGLLADCGKPIPFIDKVVFTREKEQIPYWNKFLQGYYDASGIASDVFDQAIQLSGAGEVTLTPAMRSKGIVLMTSVAASTFYMGFNMLDPLVGGLSEKARKLRQAISIAIDQEEFISIFMNGRGVVAMSPLPPGIFGHRDGKEGVNPVVYQWTAEGPRRKDIAEAKRLLAEAGWPDGRHAQSGEPLIIHLDTTATGVGAKSRIDWLIKQFQKLGVQLVVRSTDYNRFQEKVRKGAVQLFYLGWNADYPDPENFLFLLYGPQGKVAQQGENAANYANPEYDRYFEAMRAMDNGPERQALIDAMVRILQEDAPWVWGFHPLDYSLRHAWLLNRKPNRIAHNTLKYQRIDVGLRERLRTEWNRPALWPFALVAAALLALAWPIWRLHRRRERLDAYGRVR